MSVFTTKEKKEGNLEFKKSENFKYKFKVKDIKDMLNV